MVTETGKQTNNKLKWRHIAFKESLINQLVVYEKLISALLSTLL